jgi:Holliday junction resolvasome RuvABC ATP-dependent DNA helicase subunit
LRVKKLCVCRACGSVLEQSGEKYRYRTVPSPYRESGEDLCKGSWSLDDLSRVADKRWRSQQSAVEEREWREWLEGSESQYQEPGFDELLAVDEREEEERAMANHDQEGEHRNPGEVSSMVDDGMRMPQWDTFPTINAWTSQPRIQAQLSVAIHAAQARGDVLRPVLLCGGKGCGKFFLALSIIKEVQPSGQCYFANTREYPNPQTLVDDLVSWVKDQGDLSVLVFLDIHMASESLEQWLSWALPNFESRTVIGRRAALEGIEVPSHLVTVIGTTDRPERLSPRLRGSFHHICQFDPYTEDYLGDSIRSRAETLGLGMEDAACRLIASSARGDLAEALRLVDQVRDFAEVRAHGMMTADVAREALGVMGVEIGHQDLTPSSDEEPAHTGLTQTADRDQTDLESLWAQLFESLGYTNIRVVRLEGDSEDCMVMESPDPLRGTRRVCVRFEYWTSDVVGLQAVQVLHSTIVAKAELDEGIIVTSGRFSDEAITYADKIGIIQLVDETRLQALTNNPGKRSIGESPDSCGGESESGS